MPASSETSVAMTKVMLKEPHSAMLAMPVPTPTMFWRLNSPERLALGAGLKAGVQMATAMRKRTSVNRREDVGGPTRRR